jgi:antitoxin ParD1/3/4
MMAQVNVLLSDDLQTWADARVAAGLYPSASAYLGELVRRDQAQVEQQHRLQAAIDEGRASGVSERDPFAYLEELRAGLRADLGSADAA